MSKTSNSLPPPTGSQHSSFFSISALSSALSNADPIVDQLDAEMKACLENFEYEDIERLDPEWLKQQHSKNAQELFYDKVLPLLAFRMDSFGEAHEVPLHSCSAEATLPTKVWPYEKHREFIATFCLYSLDTDLVLGEFESSPISFITVLTRFLLVLRARLMCEKLWASYSEVYLLAYAAQNLKARGINHVLETQKLEEETRRCNILKDLANARSGIKRRPLVLSRKDNPEMLHEAHFKRVFAEKLQAWDNRLRNLESDTETTSEPLSMTDEVDMRLKVEATSTLQGHIHLAAGMFFERYFKVLTRFPHIKEHWYEIYELGNLQVSSWAKKLLRRCGLERTPSLSTIELRKTKIWEFYLKGPQEGPSSPTPCELLWMRVSKKVKEFCDLAGSPEVTHDALQNVRTLRKYISLRSTVAPVLYNKIEQLQQETQQQKRIIATLFARHTLENLPEQLGAATATDRWKNFCQDAFKHAPDPGHPFHAAWKRYPKNEPGSQKRRTQSCAETMYSKLSTNIHKYNGQHHNLVASQWNVDEYDLLSALVPKTSKDGEVNWEAERARFLEVRAPQEKDPPEEMEIEDFLAQRTPGNGDLNNGSGNVSNVAEKSEDEEPEAEQSSSDSEASSFSKFWAQSKRAEYSGDH